MKQKRKVVLTPIYDFVLNVASRSLSRAMFLVR